MLGLGRISCGLALLVSFVLVGGCVHTRELGGLKLEADANPPRGPAAKIVSVVDMRKFEADPGADTTPRLRNSNEIGDKAVTSKAVGFARNGAHKIHYVLTDQTVESLVAMAVSDGLRGAGYVVSDSPSATPVTVEIHKFWFTFEPGFWTIKGLTDVEFDVKSSILANGAGVEKVTGHYDISSPMYVDSIAGATVTSALGDARDKLKTKFKKAP